MGNVIIKLMKQLYLYRIKLALEQRILPEIKSMHIILIKLLIYEETILNMCASNKNNLKDKPKIMEHKRKINIPF